MKMRDVSLAELGVGLVLHLDPDSLEAAGATFSCARGARVRGGHFFVCVAHDEVSKTGRWVPVYTEDGPGRFSVDAAMKVGHEKWTTSSTVVHPGQVWTVPDSAVPLAARDGRDMSRQGSRNRMKKADALLDGKPKPPTS
jgi:hypothetical protein